MNKLTDINQMVSSNIKMEEALEAESKMDSCASSCANLDSVIETSDFNVWIKEHHILKNINVCIPKNKITCIIGPSGSGKSTLVRSLNRINDHVEGLKMEGELSMHNQSILDSSIDLAALRSKVGMVFQKPCIFPKSIEENVLFGIRELKKASKTEKKAIAEENLKCASLWEEVKDRLDEKASSLSIGQQQRLCIARTLAVKPEVILLDEPTSSLDPMSTRAIENMMLDLKKKYTLVFVTHNISQAKRIADQLIFICDGEVVEQGNAYDLFANPKQSKTRNYLNDEICEC